MAQEEFKTPEQGVDYLENVVERTRRNWMVMIGAGLNVIAGTLLAIPLVGYVFGSFAHRDKFAWVSLGHVDGFPVGQTRMAVYQNPIKTPFDGATVNTPCYVRRIEEKKFQVFAVNCAHLGCAVHWFQASGLFLCPCHGGAYYANGDRAAGPPPRGLFEYEYRLQNSELWVKAGQLPTMTQPVA
jgi:Rieske Fe-S protein